MEQYTREDLAVIVAYVKKLFPDLLQDEKLEVYMSSINTELDEAGTTGEDITKLLECRSIIEGHVAYLGDLESRYYAAKETQDCLYKEARAVIISEASSATAGKVEADKVESVTKRDYIEADRMYKKLQRAVKTLESKDKVLTQRLSHLKKVWELKQHINH